MMPLPSIKVVGEVTEMQQAIDEIRELDRELAATTLRLRDAELYGWVSSQTLIHMNNIKDELQKAHKKLLAHSTFA